MREDGRINRVEGASDVDDSSEWEEIIENIDIGDETGGSDNIKDLQDLLFC